MTNNTILVGDIGGTNARFAIVSQDTEEPQYHDERTLQCAKFPNVDQAIRDFLKQFELGDPSAICLAIAGPIDNQQVQLTNNAWRIDAKELSSQFSGCQVKIINDFTSIALSVSAMSQEDLAAVGKLMPNDLRRLDNFSVGIIGPGTGLGIAGLLRRSGHTVPVPSEAGHMGFAPETEIQIELLKILRERFPRVSGERLVSGSGLENIYWALQRMEGITVASRTAAEIFQHAQQDARSTANQAVQLFFEILGQIAGDAALAYGASDGIYIAGGMAKRYPEMLATSRFREAFESKGRHRGIVEAIPTSLIVHPEPGLLGSVLAVKNNL